MFRIIAVVMAVGILAACDNGPTGPTTTGGEVTLEVFEHREYTKEDTGEGYNFDTQNKVPITPYTRNTDDIDIYTFPTRIESYDVSIWASNNRIYIEGNKVGVIYLKYNSSKMFELLTVDGKARYKIFVQNREIGFDEKRNGTVSENVLRYKIIE